MNTLKILNWTRKVQWSDFDDLKVSPKSWKRSETPPQINEIRVVSLPKVEPEKQFWGIFEPALSFFNGWDEHPKEIDLHRIYQAELVEVLFETQDEKWAKIKILNSKKLFDVDFIEAESSSEVFIDNFKPHYYFKHGNWLSVNFSGEGDLGYEFLFYQSKDYMKLVYQFEWLFSEDKRFIHNLNCKRETIENWLKNIN